MRPTLEILMATLRQIEANRRNAQKSTGPTSVAGKAASSMNALKTGLHAKSLVIFSETLADLEELIAEYCQRHVPTTPEARLYIDELIWCVPMSPESLVKSVYLGGRARKEIVVDSWNERVSIQVDCISPIKGRFSNQGILH
jgi:hypothetical protein